MPKYKKKPVIVEAKQWHESEIDEYFNDKIWWDSQAKKYYCDTLEGKLFVSEDDWIITGVQGEFYPCKDEIFKETYEFVSDL